MIDSYSVKQYLLLIFNNDWQIEIVTLLLERDWYIRKEKMSRSLISPFNNYQKNYLELYENSG